ncbi:MAG: hypothetical protein ABJC04_06985, partial [Verrucomicrobiota bacterium]
MNEKMDDGSESKVEGQSETVAGFTPHSRPSTLDPRPPLSPNQRAWRRFRRNRPAVFSSFLLIGLIMVIIGWPVLHRPEISQHVLKSISHDPEKITDNQFAPPNGLNWFGTDVHGRDLLSRVF